MSKMWRVHGTVTGSKYLGEFEAETEEEAIEKALDYGAGSGVVENTGDEIDGSAVQESSQVRD
jgi:hypothetical protein